jgi:hypothetical protein
MSATTFEQFNKRKFIEDMRERKEEILRQSMRYELLGTDRAYNQGQADMIDEIIENLTWE